MTVTKAVLFDLDGVLCNTRDVHRDALNVALKESGCSVIEDEQHKELYDGLPTAVKLKMLVDRGLVHPGQVARISLDKKRLTKSLLPSVVKFDPQVLCVVCGVVGYELKWGVVTNAVTETALFVLERMLLPVPNTLVTNEDATPKPDPSPYLLACARLNVPPNEALVVEDGDHGVESATRAGCKVLRVRNPSEVTPDNVWSRLE